MKISEMPIWPSCSPRNRPPSDLGDADDEAADRRAREAAHAAQHDDGEGHEDEGVARGRRHVVGRHQQAGRGAEAGDADAVGHGEDVLDVDADQARALPFLGDGTDRLARVAPRHVEAERRAEHQRGAERDDLGQRQEGRPDLDEGAGVGHVDGLRVAAEEQERDIVDHDREAQRDQQDVLVAAVIVAADQQAIEHEAETEGAGDHHRQRGVGIDADQPPEIEDGIHGQHQQAAMGEIDDVQHAVDQRQPDGDKDVNAAGQKAVQDAREEEGGIEHVACA